MQKTPLTFTCALVGAALMAAIPQAQKAEAAIPFGLMEESVPSLAPIVQKVSPAVVNISTSGKVTIQNNPLLEDPLFRKFFEGLDIPSLPKEKQTQSIGSGVVVDAEKGYVLTNNHVVKGADKVYVTLSNKKKYEAKVIGKDAETDIAVIKIDGDSLTALPLGDSDSLQVGDFAVAIGNPFGLGQTVTSGIISALGRTGLGIEGYEDFIQTDASINPGNSGGALINLKGELIGINTAILAPSGGNVGIGFAIPINMAKNVMEQLVEHGKIKRGRLGIHIQDITPEISDAMGISADHGALVAKVEESSPAEKAGIKTGDIVTRLNGDDVQGASELRNKVGLMRIGEKVQLEVLREGKTLNFTIEVLEAKDDAATIIAEEAPALKGAKFSTIPADHPLYNNVKGIEVVEVNMGSPAWQAGLRKGDIVTSVNQQAVGSVEQLAKAAKASKNGILLNIRRGDAALFIVVK